eukprot:SAG11_NODE_13626_length_646_cov_1.405850_1_plen_101_part_10
MEGDTTTVLIGVAIALVIGVITYLMFGSSKSEPELEPAPTPGAAAPGAPAVPVGSARSTVPPAGADAPEEMKEAAKSLQECIDAGYGNPLRPHFGLASEYV